MFPALSIWQNFAHIYRKIESPKPERLSWFMRIAPQLNGWTHSFPLGNQYHKAPKWKENISVSWLRVCRELLDNWAEGGLHDNLQAPWFGQRRHWNHGPSSSLNLFCCVLYGCILYLMENIWYRSNDNEMKKNWRAPINNIDPLEQ